jgi:hypothetical protein
MDKEDYPDYISICPYCDKDIDEQTYQAWGGDYYLNFDFICPFCKKEIEISVESKPVFLAQEKAASGDETAN